MSDSIKMKGKSVEEAITMALQVLGKNKEDVDVRVITEGERGMLGVIGGKEAEVEVFPKVDLGEGARKLVQDILDKMDFLTLVTVKSEEADTVFLEIKGEDMGRIIGKEGNTLDALQSLCSIMLGKRLGRRIRVLLDAENYRERRQKKLAEETSIIAKEVESTGSEKALPPMSSADRRLVHMYIQESHPKLTSFSRGEGMGRQVVIGPKEEGQKGE
jgi:spoIIIJ-associated protein